MKHQKLARYPLGNPKRIWRQDGFILTLANPGVLDGAILRGMRPESEMDLEITRHGVRTCHHAGFTHFGSVWATDNMMDVIIREAESLGAKLLVCNFERFGGMGPKNVFCEKNDVLGYMEEKKNWNCIAGYLMWDEPTTVEQMKITRQMIDDAEKVRPDLCHTTVANPSGQASHTFGSMEEYIEYIENFIDIIQPPYMNFDYYPFSKNTTDHINAKLNIYSYMWVNLGIVSDAAKRHNTPFFFCYQGLNYKGCNRFTFDMERLCANAGILYGAKGLSHYAPVGMVVDRETGGRGRFFEQQREFNCEIKELGGTLMALTCKRVIHDETLLPGNKYMPKYHATLAESELLDDTPLPPNISVSEHTDEYGNMYLMVLNRDYENDIDISLALKENFRVYKVSRKDGDQYMIYENTAALTTYLQAGGLEIFRLQKIDQEPCIISYYLDK